ncbi:DNA-binding transcription factor yap1 [Mortierella sp. AD011]|nr:DNA-binding transcription factor yap1 [Mortierella sp. AD010]KAF9402333.1 DNA-binding transcription factor yap1 [Mortierella sp. AD011]
MTSTMRQLPQLRIIQQQFDRVDKRSYSSVSSSKSTNKPHTSEDDDDTNDGDHNATSNDGGHSSSSEPPVKIRKKPGRKPNPASPAVRKEQNRAAQRAFRDRKERHLQEMESMIKELKETNSQITQRLEKDTQHFKSTMDALQNENYYLRQVVFSFETALNKGGNITILQEVKAELYRSHYEKHSTKKLSGVPPSNRETRPPAPSASSIFSPDSNLPFQFAPETPRRSHEQTPIASTSSAFSNSAIPPILSTPPSPPSSFGDVSASPPSNSKDSPPTSWSGPDPDDETVLPMNNDILYKAPPLYCMIDPNGGKLLRSITPCEPPSPPRPVFTRTEYITCVRSVFDELQSSLFPPGTLQSVIHTELASPQEVVNDITMLDQLHDRRPLKDPVISPEHAAITMFAPLDAPSPCAPTSILDDDNNEFVLATPSLGLDDGLKQNVIPSKRLQLEIKVLASAPPAVDPNIDPKIYALPHDTRIDLIPCPRLRAQLILHQKKLDLEDLCQLLINGARCHGHPLDPHSWELPEEFFDRYGFLLGEEMLRHRNKVWPKKDEPQLG